MSKVLKGSKVTLSIGGVPVVEMIHDSITTVMPDFLDESGIKRAASQEEVDAAIYQLGTKFNRWMNEPRHAESCPRRLTGDAFKVAELLGTSECTCRTVLK